MKRYNFLGLMIFSLVVGSFPASANSNVDYVYDGDTITLTNGDKVRLVQIDTPELSPAECYGKEARDLLKQLIGNSKIRLTREPSADNRDDFGRLLRYVNVSSTNINLELVKRGAATPWFYKGQKGKFSKSLMKAAQIAKNKGIGLWGMCPSTVLDPTKAVDTGPVAKSPSNSNSSTSDNSSEVITPGAFCATEFAGKKALSEKGVEYTCKVSATENRLRWRR